MFVVQLFDFSLPLGVSCEQLTAVKDEESSLEGSSVTLSYSYPKLSTSNYFFWYRQYPGKPPEFLISHLGTGLKLKNEVPGLSYKVSDDKKQMDLVISSAAMPDKTSSSTGTHPTTL